MRTITNNAVIVRPTILNNVYHIASKQATKRNLNTQANITQFCIIK